MQDARFRARMPALFLKVGANMAASSVTGVGLGDSNGKQKPENHSGCGCCFGEKKQETGTNSVKKGCSIRYKNSGSIAHKINSSIISNKSCF